MKSSWARARTRLRSSEGWDEKAKPARGLIVESLAMRSAILTRRFSRSVNSSANRVSITSSALDARGRRFIRELQLELSEVDLRLIARWGLEADLKGGQGCWTNIAQHVGDSG